MNVLEYIVANWDFLLLIVLALAAVAYFVFTGNKSVVMKMLYALVTEAEREYGGGTGTLKLATVISQIYPKLPAVLKMFISEKILAQWVEDALTAAKEAWKKNAAIAEYISKPGDAVADLPAASEADPASPIASTFTKDSYN